MRRTGILLVWAASVIAPGCAVSGFKGMAPMAEYSADSEAMAARDARGVADTPDAPPSRGEPSRATEHTAAVQPRKVVYTARMEIIVADLEHALGEARKTAEGLGGYLQHLASSRITIRVPAEKFNAAVDALTKLGPVASRDITAQDVTEQYTDLEIRLANARAALKRLQALLEKASNVKDVLAIEKELIRVRTEIERLQGRMNLLKNRIAYATITVSFRRAAHVSGHIRVKLPFWWLSQLGLETLMDF